VRVADEIVGEIREGLLVLLGVSRDDGDQDACYLAGKTAGLRVFEDESGKMNRSVTEVGGQDEEGTAVRDLQRGETARPRNDGLPELNRIAGEKRPLLVVPYKGNRALSFHDLCRRPRLGVR
jgi:D-tyrosyl-tRNA(Tyr) deacylase